jgi:hypothetical protein
MPKKYSDAESVELRGLVVPNVDTTLRRRILLVPEGRVVLDSEEIAPRIDNEEPVIVGERKGQAQLLNTRVFTPDDVFDAVTNVGASSPDNDSLSPGLAVVEAN